MASKKKATRKKAGPKRKRVTLHIVSDATGNLASHMLNAVLTQFPNASFRKIYHNFQNHAEDVEETIRALRRRSNHVVLHALTNPESKAALKQACADRLIPQYDLTGSLVQFISDHIGQAPLNEQSRLHETDAGYFHRIEAMEFTAQHDDGRRIESIGEADIVLIGLSRVSKSPTSTFLGSMGWKVANVSIAQETGFPPELNKVKRKVVALTIRPKVLYEIRLKRFDRFKEKIQETGANPLPYTNLRAVVREVVYAEKEYRKRGYPIIDTTEHTVEQTAAQVLRSLKLKRKEFHYSD